MVIVDAVMARAFAARRAAVAHLACVAARDAGGRTGAGAARGLVRHEAVVDRPVAVVVDAVASGVGARQRRLGLAAARDVAGDAARAPGAGASADTARG